MSAIEHIYKQYNTVWKYKSCKRCIFLYSMNTQLMHFQLTLSYSLLCLISEEGNICLVNILYSKSTLRRITEIYIVYTICIFTRCCTVLANRNELFYLKVQFRPRKPISYCLLPDMFFHVININSFTQCDSLSCLFAVDTGS
jgi:hypothetical protein